MLPPIAAVKQNALTAAKSGNHKQGPALHKKELPQKNHQSQHSVAAVDDWQWNPFVRDHIVPKDSVFNTGLVGDANEYVRQELRRHDTLVQQFRPAPPPLDISPLEKEALKILKGHPRLIGGALMRSAGSLGRMLLEDKRAREQEEQEEQRRRERQKEEQQQKGGVGTPFKANMGLANFRRIGKAVTRANVAFAYKRTLLPPIDRFRLAARAVCRAVRNSKIDQGILLTSGISTNHPSHLLSDHSMQIWVKEPKDRSNSDIDYLERGLALMKCFSKYSKSVRRELGRMAHLEGFPSGRVVLRQGHSPLSMYFIISGAVEVVKSDTDAHSGKTFSQTVAQLSVGDGFGDVALINKTKRTASAICRTEAKLLRLDDDDYYAVLSMAQQQEMQSKYEFIRRLSVFADMQGQPELKHLAELAQLKDFTAASIITTDLDASEEIYFLRKGTCRVVEPVEFVKETLSGGRFELHPFIRQKKLKPTEQLVNKLLITETPTKGTFFGARNLATQPSRRRALAEVFAKSAGKRGVAVIANTKVECLLIKKVDYLRYATDRSFEVLRSEVFQKVATHEEIVGSFLANRSWDNHKRLAIQEITDTFRQQKQLQKTLAHSS